MSSKHLPAARIRTCNSVRSRFIYYKVESILWEFRNCTRVPSIRLAFPARADVACECCRRWPKICDIKEVPTEYETNLDTESVLLSRRHQYWYSITR